MQQLQYSVTRDIAWVPIGIGHREIGGFEKILLGESQLPQRGRRLEVAGEVEEMSDIARALSLVLECEGALHEMNGESTLRACRALVDLLDPDEEESE